MPGQTGVKPPKVKFCGQTHELQSCEFIPSKTWLGKASNERNAILDHPKELEPVLFRPHIAGLVKIHLIGDMSDTWAQAYRHSSDLQVPIQASQVIDPGDGR